MLCVDGGAGLLAALPTAFPTSRAALLGTQIRNVLNKVRKPDEAAIKASLHRIMNCSVFSTALPLSSAQASCIADRE